MSLLGQKISNLIQYFGLDSKNYHHSDNPANYNSDDRLAYYLDLSKRAKYDGRIDEAGIPVYEQKGRNSRHPAIAMLYALGNNEVYRKTKDPKNRQCLTSVADWLSKNQDEQGGWKSTAPMPKFGLSGPFYSSLIQGFGISTLVRATLVSQNEEYVKSAVKALKPYQIDIKAGGISRVIDGYTFFEEYPSPGKYHVLNGFIYSLWGLLDLVRYNSHEHAHLLWESGLETLAHILSKYDTGSWSLYHIGDGMKNPATITYHKIHIEQLKAMHDITGQKIFIEYSDKWNDYLKNRFNALKTLPRKILWNLARGL